MYFQTTPTKRWWNAAWSSRQTMTAKPNKTLPPPNATTAFATASCFPFATSKARSLALVAASSTRANPNTSIHQKHRCFQKGVSSMACLKAAPPCESVVMRWSPRAIWTWWRWRRWDLAMRWPLWALPARLTTCTSCSGSPTTWCLVLTAMAQGDVPHAKHLRLPCPMPRIPAR